MIEYRCPNDGKLLFEAEGPLATVVKTICRGCKQKVTPVAKSGSVLHRTYECSKCHRTQHCEKPKNDRTYCIVCGTPTLVIVAEVPARPTPQRPSNDPQMTPTRVQAHG